MSELSLAIQREVMGRLCSKTVIINGKGDLSVDGTTISGLDGARALMVFAEGVEEDVVAFGPAETRRMYWRKSRTPGSLGKALQTSVNISRMFDVEDII